MSRGPGFWQRAILAAFDEAESFYLVDVLPDGYTKAQYNAAHRAAQKLDDHGRIGLWRFTFGTPHVVIGRPGIKPERPDGGGMGGPDADGNWFAPHQRLIVGVGADLPAGQHIPVSDGARLNWAAQGQHLVVGADD